MREIKFRGKSTETKLHTAQWRFGSLLTPSNEACKPLIFVHFSKPTHDGNGYWYEVEADTVGQFTGLRDADGREIYEGDVIKLDNEVYTVSWAKYSACWFVDLKNFGPSLFTQYHAGKSIVIGNFHDNPGLLEGKDARD